MPAFTPAEVKSVRESLGLTTRWLAHRWRTAENSVKRWETSRFLPDDLADDLRALVALRDAQVEAGCEARLPCIEVPRLDADSIDDFPAAWHRAIALEVADSTGAALTWGPA